MRYKSLFLFDIFLLIASFLFGQKKMFISSKAEVAYLLCDYVGWQNWTIEHKNELDSVGRKVVYYDSLYKYKGLEWEGKMKEGELYQYAFTSYFLNGHKMTQEVYKDSVSSETIFTIGGDTQMVNIYDYHHGGSSTWKSWTEDLVTGKFYLAAVTHSSQNQQEYYQHCFDAAGHKIGCDNGGSKHILELDYRDSTRLNANNLDKETEIVRVNLKKASASFIRKLEILATLPHLKTLSIYGWPEESFPSFALKCLNLENLTLTYSKTKIIPASISALKHLHSISFSQDSALDYEASFKSLSLLPNLRSLVLPLDLGKPLPANLTLLKQLYFLSVGDYGVCTKDSTPDIGLKTIYQLKQLRRLEVCYDQFYKIDPFEFAAHLPNCHLTQVETCFITETKISLPGGEQKSIALIRTGDLVLAYDSATQKFDTAIVLKTFMHDQPLQGMLEFTVQGISDSAISFHFEVTALHPFYTSGHWEIAGRLKEGESLLYRTADGKAIEVKIKSIYQVHESAEPVYNIRTSKHTYIANGIVVHNK